MLRASGSCSDPLCETGGDCDFKDRSGEPSSLDCLCTGLVVMDKFKAKNNSDFNASNGVIFSSTATFFTFHMNSQMATIRANMQPNNSTTKTPPTFAMPNSAAPDATVELSDLHLPDDDKELMLI